MITQIELKDIPGRNCHFNNAISQEILQFHGSDWSAAEVNIGKYKTTHSAGAAYRNAVKTLKVNVLVIEREGRLFLLKGGA